MEEDGKKSIKKRSLEKSLEVNKSSSMIFLGWEFPFIKDQAIRELSSFMRSFISQTS